MLCPSLLYMTILATSVGAHELQGFSMYDEFGDIMRNNPNHIVQQSSIQNMNVEATGPELSQYQFRPESLKGLNLASPRGHTNSLTSSTKNPFSQQQQVWKFRPLDEDKQKQVIKIEDIPVPSFKPQQPTSPGVYQGGAYQGAYPWGYHGGYSGGYTGAYPGGFMGTYPMMTPMVSPVPMFAPGTVYPFMPYGY